MKKQILSLLFVLVISINGSTQSFEEKTNELLNGQFPKSEPGATALVAIDGEIVYHKAFGMANLELEVPMQPGMVFRVASISKQFTAISILMLMEQGKLNLDDDITKYIEDYPTNGQHISIQDLLTHTSGISRNITLNPWNEDVRKSDFEPLSFIDYFKNEPMASAPGEVYRYNNFGYFILGYIIEQVSGKTYGQFVESNIFQPLGMHNSCQANDEDIVKNRAYGYEKKDVFINKEYTSITQANGAGSLMSTVKDLFIWNRALKNNLLVKKETLALAYKNYELIDGGKINYGFGFFINEINGSPTIEHAGGDHGFRTNAIYMPNEDVFVAVFANCSCNDPRTVSTKIAALAIDKPYKRSLSASITTNKWHEWVGTYHLSDGAKQSISLDENQLYCTRYGRQYKLIPTSQNTFVFENDIMKLNFTEKGDSVETIFSNRIKTAKAMKLLNRHTEVKISNKVLERYVGTFELFPDFDINIILEEGQLYSMGTDQDRLRIYPKSGTKFFYKTIDATIEFKSDEKGEYKSFILTQDGLEYPGKKK